jgi:hypothetical protein
MRWQLSGRLMLIKRPPCDEDFGSARHEYLHPELLLLLTSSFARHRNRTGRSMRPLACVHLRRIRLRSRCSLHNQDFLSRAFVGNDDIDAPRA